MTDELLGRLAANNPIPRSEIDRLPSATNPEAQDLLGRITSGEGDAETNDQIESATEFAFTGRGDFDAPPTATSPGPPRSGRRLQLLTAAAAVLLLVMGAVVLWPSNTEPALASVHNAAASTANANTGRATTTLTMEANDSEETAAGVGTLLVTFADRDVAFELDVSQIEGPSQGSGAFGSVAEGRYVDGVIYGKIDDRWVSFEAPGLIAGAALEIADPRSILSTVQELVETDDLGQTTIDGQAVTHYRSVIDLGEDTLGGAGLLAGLESQIDLGADGEVVLDLYVDELDRMYRVDVHGDIQETEGTGTASFSVVTVFSEIGADLSVEAPTDAEPLGLSEFDENPLEADD